MDEKLITRCEEDVIFEYTPENAERFGMLEDFLLRSNTEENTYLRLTMENGSKAIKAAGYVGVLTLSDGCCIELLPKIPGIKKGDHAGTRKVLYKMLSSLFSIPYEESAGESEASGNTFLEFFITVFVRECMKIVKSGLLSGYESVEENTSQVKGTILFAENNRRNLVHRERLYVRHDVFTPDRVENRLMKSTAQVMSKLSKSLQNTQSLKKILSILEDVEFSDNYDADLAKCINTRNTKKYSVVLNLCRLFLRTKNRNYSGKYVSYALLLSMDDIFRAYAAGLVKEKNPDRSVRTKIAGRYLCDEQQFFGLYPDIVVTNSRNQTEFVINTRWRKVESAADIPLTEVYTLFTYAKKFECSNVILIYPHSGETTELPNGGSFIITCQGNISLHIKFVKLT